MTWTVSSQVKKKCWNGGKIFQAKGNMSRALQWEGICFISVAQRRAGCLEAQSRRGGAWREVWKKM